MTQSSSMYIIDCVIYNMFGIYTQSINTDSRWAYGLDGIIVVMRTVCVNITQDYHTYGYWMIREFSYYNIQSTKIIHVNIVIRIYYTYITHDAVIYHVDIS